ncbi:MAG: GNAT family N-acetyltransferase [Oscillospiraceae bacterium]|nr:GNAT family N-acetyltransferase [Oscillospiraceae bacterium]
MDQLRLIPPTKADEGKVMDYRAELLARGGGAGGCRKLLETADYDRWLDPGTRRRTPGWVESSVYLAMRPADKRLVGMVECRHHLTEFLLRYGGHVSYSVRPSEQRKGYATELLAQACRVYRGWGVSRILVTCDRGNEASRRTILANGGVMEDEVADKPRLGRTGVVQRYWIELEGDD